MASQAERELNALGIASDHDTPEPLPQRDEVIALGYDRGVFYYLSQSARQIFAIPADKHGEKIFLAMGTIAHTWKSYPAGPSGEPLWSRVQEELMAKCREVGVFNPDTIRGRGAWLDGDKSVLHIGDALIVDGKRAELQVPGSTYHYEAAQKTISGTGKPLSDERARYLLDICKLLKWEQPISGVLLAGWIAIAPICGALKWRPSIWLTTSAGAGKSYIVDKIIGNSLGKFCLKVLSKTSEAGIRQILRSDALPVIFDEAEGEDPQAASRMQGVLDIVRQSSSDSSASIVKGTANPKGIAFRVRSAFCFASINVGISHHADETRITTLALRKPPDPDDKAAVAEAAEHFERLQTLVTDTVTPEFSSSLVERSGALLFVIRHNADVFARAIALHLGNRRAGDQLGALLAGAFSLTSDRKITDEQALNYLATQDWTEVTAPEVQSDESMLISHLTQWRHRYSPGGAPSRETPIGKLMSACFFQDDDIVSSVATVELLHCGIKCAFRDNQRGFYISTSHSTLKRIFAGTQWAANWGRAFGRISGAIRGEQRNIRFAAGHQSKAVFIPWSAIDGDT